MKHLSHAEVVAGVVDGFLEDYTAEEAVLLAEPRYQYCFAGEFYDNMVNKLYLSRRQWSEIWLANFCIDNEIRLAA